VKVPPMSTAMRNRGSSEDVVSRAMGVISPCNDPVEAKSFDL
jgi:hypothetical protein